MTKLSELKAGDTLIADAGFTCMAAGETEVTADSEGSLYVVCEDGVHYLAGQVDFEDHDTLVGLKLKGE